MIMVFMRLWALKDWNKSSTTLITKIAQLQQKEDNQWCLNKMRMH